MFKQLQAAPPDAILGLNEAFQADPNPDKINLTAGVFTDANGTTPILTCVKEAERRLLDAEPTKSYLGIDGMPEFRRAAREVVFGPKHEHVECGRSVTVQTPGGTGALRVAADFIATNFPRAKVWCSRPTWPNHPSVFQAAGLRVETYAYFDKLTNGLDFDSMLEVLRQVPAGDVVCLHACCHNPTGVDPSAEQWRQIADVVSERGLLPLLDFAYQGFGESLRKDAIGLEALCRDSSELLVASSFSKNFGLYRERVGTLSVVAAEADAAQVVLSQLKSCIRANYSNPPGHGAAIVAVILEDPELRGQWEVELAAMRDRINAMRRLFVETMTSQTSALDFSFLARQRGMFSFSGLSVEQVDRLRAEHSIYVVRNGRINVGGITESNVEPLCSAIASVL